MTDVRLAKLADEMEIRNLVARIAHLTDFGPDLEDYLALWTEDGVYEMGEAPAAPPGAPSRAAKTSGHDALRESRTRLRAMGVQGPGTDLWHLNTTLAVQVHGDDTATADSYWLVATGRGRPAIFSLGHYHDSFRRTAEGWKLAYRKVTPAVSGPAADEARRIMRAAPAPG